MTGRLLSNEVPQPGVRVKLERVRPSSSEPRRPGSITSESSSEGTFDFEFEGGQGRRSYDLDRFTGRKRRETSDARGSFLFGGLAGGTYRVSLDSRTLAPASWTDLVVVAGETHELGDLQVEPEAELEVVPVAPRLGGLSGLTIAIEAEGGEEEVRRVRRSKEGEPVVFKDLPSGSYRLSVEDVPGIVLDLRDVPVTLTAGERRGLELDLAPWQPVPVEVVVRCGGEPLRGVRVAVGRLESSGWIARSPVPSQRPTVPPDLATPGAYLASIRSGRTDDQGRVIFVLPAAEVFDLRIGHEAAPLAIEQDQRTAAGMPLRVIELEAGRLQVELPDIAPSVGVGRLDLTLFDVRAQEVQTSSFVFQEGRAHGDSPDPIEDTDLGHLPPGTYVVEVRRQVLAREVLEALNAQLAPDDGSTPEERAERAVWAAQFQPGLLVEDLVYRATGEVRSGEVTRCRPEPAAPTPPPASPTR